MTCKFTLRISTKEKKRVACEESERVTKMKDRYFVSNWGGNLRVLRSFSSLSEKRRSWSVDEPLKMPKRDVNE
jgi:hypothetical protein